MEEIKPEELFEKLVTGGNIAVVVGRRGSGKTSLGFATVEEARKRNKECFIVGFPEEAKKYLPGYVQIIEELKDAPNGAFVMMDEAVLQYNARMWRQGKHMGLLEIIDLARHKDLSVVFLAINTAMLDPNILRSIDTLIIKEPSLLQEFMERPFLKKFISKVMKEFQNIKPEDRNKYAYLFDDKFEGIVATSLPTFWSDDISKSWKDYASISDTEVKGIKVVGAGSLPVGERPICFNCQFFVHTQHEAWCAKGLDVGVSECPQFAPKKQAKIWSFRKEKKPTNRAWRNPPGTEICERCSNCQGESDVGVMCKHYERPVKFIDGDCKHFTRFNPLEEHKLLDEARSYYANFKVRSRGKMVIWNAWKEYSEKHGFKNVAEEEGGTDEYWGGGSQPPDENVRTQIHLTQKPRREETLYPMSCNCQKWRTTHICDHANKLAQLILAFAHANQIPQQGEQWLRPPGDWKDKWSKHEDSTLEGQKGEHWDTDYDHGGKEHKSGEREHGGKGKGGEGEEGEGECEGQAEPCDKCGGTGEVQAPDFPEGYTMPCPDCHGTGVKGAPRGMGRGQESEGEGEGECPDCEGTGEKPCSSCEGTGTIPGTEGEGEGGHGKDCPDCQGTGLSDEKCSSCGGTGTGKGKGKGKSKGDGDDAPPRYQIGDRVILPTGQTGIVVEIYDREDGGQRLKVEIEG
jgi:hypothetical protein